MFWMRGKDTIEFLGLWEQLHNTKFKAIEFDRFRKEAGYNAFSLSPKKWIENTNAIGMVSKSGRYGGTFAHSDIAFEFASWVSAEFKLYIIKDYKRLKSDESSRLSLNWNLNREISRLNYKIHTNAIKENLIPPELTSFNNGNIRDHANLNQLLVLANMESYNAILVEQGKPQSERLKILNNLAISQLEKLKEINTDSVNKLRS